MKKGKRMIMIYGLIFLLIIILTVVSIFLFNPLRKSREQIRENILKLTPIGTSMEDVIEIIESEKKWEIDYVSYDYGYKKHPIDTSVNEIIIVGEKSISVFIGEYKDFFFFTTFVTIFFGFDEESKLIEIYVWKDIDSL